MASKKKTNKVVSCASSEKSVNAALESLTDMLAASAKAVIAVGKENKTLAAAAKRLSKKRAALTKKKKNASARVKKEANADNKKALKAIVKELTSVKNEASKIATKKTAVLAELNGLKTVSKRAAAYTKAIDSADKVLNKPKKKKRKKKAVKKVA